MRRLKLKSVVPGMLALSVSLAQYPILVHAETIDFTSTDKSATAVGDAQIKVGDQTMHVSAGQKVTYGEAAAVAQYLSGGQTILLGSGGAATGGSVVLSQVASGSITGLNIPHGLTAIQDFGQAASLNISGNFTNSGNFYAVSSNQAVTVANILAANISNNAGALLTTVLPSTGLSGFSNLVANLGLNLSATNALINSGTISSAGSFSATAANITNSGLMQSATAMNLQALSIVNQGAMLAQAGNLSMIANSIANVGTLQSVIGDIHLTELFGNSLSISNQGGLISAGHDLIAEIAGDALKPDLSITGGILRSGNLKTFNAANGHLDINVQDMGGDVSINAGTLGLKVASGTSPFNLVHLNVTGDPNMDINAPSYNNLALLQTFGGYLKITATAGDIIAGAIDTTNAGVGSNVGSVTLNATGNITTGDILTGSAVGQSGLVTVSAGNNVSTGAINSPGLTALITAGGTIDVTYPTGGNLLTTPLSLNSPGAKTVSATANGFAVGANSLTSLGAGALTVNALAGTISFSNGTVVNSASPVVFSANTIDLSSATNLTFSSMGSVGTGFLTSTALRSGNGGIILPGGALQLTFRGAGGELSDNRAVGTGFTNFGSTALLVNSDGDVDVQADTINMGGGSAFFNIPNYNFFVSEITARSQNPTVFNNVSNQGGLLGLVSNGRITLQGFFSNTNNYLDTGGISVYSGLSGPANAPNTVTGIVSNAQINSTGYIVLNVSNTNTLVPANPTLPSILVNGPINSTGSFLNNLNGLVGGGGVELSVNTQPVGGLAGQMATYRPTLYVATVNGTIENTPFAPVTTPNMATGGFAGGGTITATGNGAVIIDENAGLTPGLVSGNGQLNAFGGIIYAGGASIVGEVTVDAPVTATVATNPTPPTPPVAPVVAVIADPPVDVLPIVDVTPAGGGGGGPAATATVLQTDTTTSQAALPAASTVQATRDSQPLQLTPSTFNRAEQVILNPCAIVEMQPPDNINFKHIKEPPMLVTFDETQMSLLPPTAVDEKAQRLSVRLETGRIMIVTSAASCSVVVQCPGRPVQAIDVPKNSSVVIERRSNGAIAVASLEGPGTSVALFDESGSESSKKVIAINPNTNLVMASDDELLIPIEGGCECAVGASLRLEINEGSPLVAQTRTITDRKKFLYRGTGDCFVTDSRDRDVQRIQRKMKEIQAELPASRQPSPNRPSPLAPVAYTVPANPPKPAHLIQPGKTILTSARRFESLDLPSGSVKTSPDSHVTVDDSGVIKITSGEFLYCADKKTTLKINDMKVDVARGAMILVSATKGFMSVVNLWEEGIKDVHVTIAGSQVHLTTGHQVIVSEKGEKPMDILKTQGFARREVKINAFDGGRNLISADVSLQTALYQCNLLRSVAITPDEECKKIRDRVVKMAAVLTVATAGHGGYQFSGLK